MSNIIKNRDQISQWSIDATHGVRSIEISDSRKNLISYFKQLSRIPADRIIWMTVISAAILVKSGDHSHIVAGLMERVERQIARRCRSKLPGMRLRGAHEIDVIARSAIRCAPHKRALVSKLGIDVDAIEADQRVLIVHLHCVIDRGQHSAENVSDQFRAEFPGSYRVMAKPLSDDRSVSENLTRLAKYCTKFKVAYSDSWCDRNTRYAGRYEKEWVETIVSTIKNIGVDRMVYRYGGA